jgi:predicted Fe-Mo cluster-binding NifX family protein
MKLCIPTSGSGGLTEAVYPHFGSAPYFTLVDTESLETRCVENPDHGHQHGMCRPLDAIRELGAEAILTGGMGRRAVDALNRGGIRVFLLAGATVAEAVRKHGSGELPELTLEAACGGHGHGHGCC